MYFYIIYTFIKCIFCSFIFIKSNLCILFAHLIYNVMGYYIYSPAIPGLLTPLSA